MKALKNFSVLILLLALGFNLKAQDYGDEKLNLPGDNLNLYAVMDLFQQSETLEGFERNLNAADAKVNNLDLNGDNLIDYIKVIDYADGDDHTIVLQVAINQKENQDVAVFTVYKDNRGQVQVQLIGDEYLYGKNYIIEPMTAASETPNPGYAGNRPVKTVVVTRTTYVEVQSWPVVRYIFAPSYVVWHSPWFWGYYPTYWSPWHPYYWDYYYGYQSQWHNHYYSHYCHSDHYRYPHYADNYYRGHRSHSSTVHAYRESGRYNTTYSRPDLRREGVEQYKKDYASNDRGSSRIGTSGSGRTKSDVRSAGNSRSEKPMVNNRSSKPSGRSSEGQGVSKPANRQENNSRTVKPSDSRSSTKPSARTSSGREVSKPANRQENNSRAVKPSDSRSSTKPSARTSNSQEVRKPAQRQDNSSRAVKPSDSRSSNGPSARNSSSQEVRKPAGRTDNNSKSVRSSDSRSSSRPSANTSGRQNVSQQSNSRNASVSPARTSGNSSSKGDRTSNQSRKSGSVESKGKSGR